jgi:hypothetical protein
MNIFYLNPDPKVCAEMHLDKHVVKMIIEYAQLMSTTHRVLDGDKYIDKTSNNRNIQRWRMKNEIIEYGLMKASHVNHPSNIWVRASKQNYMWLYQMWTHLLTEYTYRYSKNHACEKYAKHLCVPPENIADIPFTEPTPAMPDAYKVPGDSISSYRMYYIQDKARFANWKKRSVPQWFSTGVINNANIQLSSP